MQRITDIVMCSSYVVIGKKGNHVATVQFNQTRSGTVQCDVYAKFTTDNRGMELVHQGKACGYGYDKRAAALAGAVIEGYHMADHCGSAGATDDAKRDALLKAYRKARDQVGTDREHVAKRDLDEKFRLKAAKLGCRFANYGMLGSPGWGSLYFEVGLERLRVVGYRVVVAI